MVGGSSPPSGVSFFSKNSLLKLLFNNGNRVMFLPIITNRPYYDKYSLSKSRKCMNCDKEVADDGSVAYLRGFCSDVCYQRFLEKTKGGVKKTKGLNYI